MSVRSDLRIWGWWGEYRRNLSRRSGEEMGRERRGRERRDGEWQDGLGCFEERVVVSRGICLWEKDVQGRAVVGGHVVVWEIGEDRRIVCVLNSRECWEVSQDSQGGCKGDERARGWYSSWMGE